MDSWDYRFLWRQTMAHACLSTLYKYTQPPRLYLRFVFPGHYTCIPMFGIHTVVHGPITSDRLKFVTWYIHCMCGY